MAGVALGGGGPPDPPGLGPAVAQPAVVVGGPEFLILPEPEGAGVLNHGGANNLQQILNVSQVDKKETTKSPDTLEDLCVQAYLKYLETEIVTYISLTQTKSILVRGVAKKMLQILKDDINHKLTGVASSVLREKMITLILSEKFPSMEYCNMYLTENRDDQDSDNIDEDEMIVHTCPNICCTGAFIQEGMLGVVMSSEVRQLIFTNEKVRSRRQFHGALEFNVPVVLTHLLGATEGRVSQLERLVFSENFVREENENEQKPRKRSLPRYDQTDKQQAFARHFGQGNIYDTSDRRGIAVDLLILFRDIHPKGLQYTKLTELILKNNIQCKFYSKANFQFELLARIGVCCPRLKVLDVFGTDTWADCLIALFFKDAFCSLHRYLYFMENEEDECSEYHPHDTTRYCQFCLDQWHPNQVERPFTNNPVIPLLDSVYNHVIKRYPKRSYCILRNCVRVSDLISSKDATVFELVRPQRSPSCRVCQTDPLACCSEQLNHPEGSSSAGEVANNCIKGRLRKGIPITVKLKEQGGGRNCCDKATIRCRKSKNASTDAPASGESSRHGSGVPRRSTRSSLSREEKRHQNTWSLASRLPEKRQSVAGRRSSVKNRELFSLVRERSATLSDGSSSSSDSLTQELSSARGNGVLTRAMKRKLETSLGNSDDHVVLKKRRSCASSSASSWAGGENSTSSSPTDRQPWSKTNSRISGGNSRANGSKARDAAALPDRISGEEEDDDDDEDDDEDEMEQDGVPTESEVMDTVDYAQWCEERSNRDESFPPFVCNKNGSASHKYCDHHDLWFEPDRIKYREIKNWPHLNPCVNTLEILNIGGSNVLGEFLPFILLHTPRLKSLGQWLNTMIYGLEILKDLPAYKTYRNYQLQEFSYSSDRNYFCQPYIGFVPETSEFKNVRREMVRYSNRSATRTGHKRRFPSEKRRQIMEDIDLMTFSCPNLRKINLVVHYKMVILDSSHTLVWSPLLRLKHLVELDLVTMKFDNVRSLLSLIGDKLEKLTLECDEEQGTGSEIVHLARSCPNITSLRILLGDKVLRGEMTLHFGQSFFRKLERLTVEGNVHLHGFAFLWGHCQNLKYMKIGLVVSNELSNTNVLIQDVFSLLFQVNSMVHLEELHIKNLKVRSLSMALSILDHLPALKKASNWYLDLHGEDLNIFRKHIKKLTSRGLILEYDRL